MAQSEVELVNDALIRLGQQTIASLTEDSKRAKLANQIYDVKRREVLNEHAWNDAETRAVLALLTEIPVWGFSNAYQLPSDFLRLSRIQPPEFEFRLERIETSPGIFKRIIAANEDTLSIVYVADITDVVAMGPLLKDCISKRLSAELAKSLTGSTSTRNEMWALYKDAIAEARFQDSQQGPVDQMAGSTWLDSRNAVEPIFRPIEDASP